MCHSCCRCEIEKEKALHALLAGKREEIALLNTILSETRTMASDIERIGAALAGLAADQQVVSGLISEIAAEVAELVAERPQLQSLADKAEAAKAAVDAQVVAMQALVPAPVVPPAA